MMINLPEALLHSLRLEVQDGRFASVDDAIVEAVRLLLGQRDRSKAEQERVGAGEQSGPAHKPIWEVFEEITAGIPDGEWAKLPTDGAEQHDHYIHGTAKRPVT